MLTEILFFIAYLVLLPVVFMFPYAGALAYEWLQYMPPYAVYNAYGVENLSIIMGGLGIGLWIAKDKKEKPQPGWLITIFILYVVWVNITQLTTIVGSAGVTLWDRAWKTLLFSFLLAFMARTKYRIEALLWVICLSIGNFILSGAVKTALSGGGGMTVVGSQSSMLGDSVNFAIVVSALIPFVRYLRNHAELIKRTKTVLIGMDLFTAACVMTVIGTQRRTGIVSLGVLAVFYFFKSKRKLAYLSLLPVLGGLFLVVAPAGYFDRMNTITNYQEDGSALGRLSSWSWGWDFTLSHPIFGGGFHSYVLHRFPDPDSPNFLEAHNILFETMADHGFVGLGLFLLLIAGTMMNCQKLIKRSRQLPELEWAGNLGAMLQLALWTFMVGSQFLSDATYSFPYEIAAISMAARGVVERRLARDGTPAFAFNTHIAPRPASIPVGKPPVPAMAYGRARSS